MKNVEVLIIGGGPAGATLAYQLGCEGFDVLLVEKRQFPREKVCGEFLNPRGTKLLKQMGLYSRVACLKPEAVQGQILHAYDQTQMKGSYEGANGLALKRPVLDKVLLDAAKECDTVTVWENARVDDIESIPDRGYACHIRLKNSETITVHPQILIGADGVNSIVRKKAFSAKTKPFQTKYALASRFENVPHENSGEMFLFSQGYIGLAPLGTNTVGLSLVIGKKESLKIKGDREKFFHDALKSIPPLSKRLAQAKQLCPVEATGWGAHYSKRVIKNNAVLIGDAACFIDPFTGEGMSLALLSSWFFVQAIKKYHKKQMSLKKALKQYQRQYHLYFIPTAIRCLLLQSVLYRPKWVNSFLRKITNNEKSANHLVQVFGGVKPQRTLLSIPFWYAALKQGVLK